MTKPVPTKPQAISTTSFSDQFSLLNDKIGAPLPGGAGRSRRASSNVDSKALQNGGNDWIYGNADRDLLIGGTGNDAIDGGIENDLILGDNASLVRTYHDTTSARFQSLCGTLLYSRSDETNPCAGTAPSADNERRAARRTASRSRTATRTTRRGGPSTTSRTSAHDFAADDGLQWAGSFGNDYLAGGAGNDVDPRRARQRHDPGRRLDRLRLAGQPDDGVRRHPGRAARRRVPARRPAAPAPPDDRLRPDRRARHLRVGRARDRRRGLHRGQRRQRRHLRQPRPGRPRRRQLRLLQPDHAGLRPNGGVRPGDRRAARGGTGDVGHDLIFGGAGTEIASTTTRLTLRRTAPTAADMHARDADTIVGDNGDIIRIVGVNGADVARLHATTELRATLNDRTRCATSPSTTTTTTRRSRRRTARTASSSSTA